MSENDEFEPEVINPNLTQDDVLSLSAVYGLTLNKRQKETAMKNDKLNQKYAGGSTPDLRYENFTDYVVYHFYQLEVTFEKYLGSFKN